MQLVAVWPLRAQHTRRRLQAECRQIIAVPQRVLDRILGALGEIGPGLAAETVCGFGKPAAYRLNPAAEHAGQAHHQTTRIRHQNGVLPQILLLMRGEKTRRLGNVLRDGMVEFHAQKMSMNSARYKLR